ncbi:MAG: helix-turn-helix domain-containing protein [Verrucomicrobiota bacterium]
MMFDPGRISSMAHPLDECIEPGIDTPEQRAVLAEQLSGLPIFKSTERAFQELFEMPLVLRTEDDKQPALADFKDAHPCALLHGSTDAWKACRETHLRLIHQARDSSLCAVCWAGVSVIVTPVRYQNTPLFYLFSGRVRESEPKPRDVALLHSELSCIGLKHSYDEIEESIRKLPLLSRAQLRHCLTLLDLLAISLEVLMVDLLHEQSLDHQPAPVRKACRLIEESINSAVGLEEVASACGVSSGHLSRLFRDHLGRSFSEHLRHQRVERAAHLLECSQRPISEIAFDAGFQSISQFNRAFRSLKEVTPSTYRARHFTKRQRRTA